MSFLCLREWGLGIGPFIPTPPWPGWHEGPTVDGGNLASPTFPQIPSVLEFGVDKVLQQLLSKPLALNRRCILTVATKRCRCPEVPAGAQGDSLLGQLGAGLCHCLICDI